MFAFVGAVKELAVEELDGHDGKDKVEEHVDDQDVENVLQRVDDAIEDGFELGHALDGFERSQDSQHSQRFDGAQILAGRASPELSKCTASKAPIRPIHLAT